MKLEDRKAAVAAHKERKAVAGIYVVRCAATGQQWVGSAPDLATIWNRLSFALRQGTHFRRTLQAASQDHGANIFALEIVKRNNTKKITNTKTDPN